MELKFISLISGQSPKFTIHKNGNLGVNTAAERLLNLTENSFIKFAKSPQKKDDLVFIITKQEDKEAFKVKKTGGYYQFNTRRLWRYLGIDYVKRKVVFDIKLNAFDKGYHLMSFRDITRKEIKL